MTETKKEPISNEIIPDYWIISGQVFKNKEDFVKQQMEFNPGDIRENWESSFDHFAIPVYRNPIFVSEYENGVKTSFVRKNKVLQEQLNTAKKALTEAEKMYQKQMDRFLNSEMNESARSHCENQLKLLSPAHKAYDAIPAIGDEGSGDESY